MDIVHIGVKERLPTTSSYYAIFSHVQDDGRNTGR